MATPPSFKLPKEVACGSLAASLTACLFNPLELVKTRLQVQHQYACTESGALMYSGFLHGLRKISAEEGVVALWRHGFVGFVGRDFTYSGLRIGLYGHVRELISLEKTGQTASLTSKILSGCTTGVIGSAIATPMDVMRVRTSVESGLIVGRVFETGLCRGREPQFRGALECFALLYREGGIVAMWRGWLPTCARAAALSGAQLASYDHSKVMLLRYGVFENETTTLHCVCAVFSALMAVTACNPPDVLKSRMMLGATAGSPQLSLLGIVAAISREQGPMGFYRGWVPAACRAVPAFFIQMPIVEGLRARMGLESI